MYVNVLKFKKITNYVNKKCQLKFISIKTVKNHWRSSLVAQIKKTINYPSPLELLQPKIHKSISRDEKIGSFEMLPTRLNFSNH